MAHLSDLVANKNKTKVDRELIVIQFNSTYLGVWNNFSSSWDVQKVISLSFIILLEIEYVSNVYILNT